MKQVLENMDLCYGCAACANICAKYNAIEMKPDEDGFLYPIIDQNKCVDCYACQRVCPQLYPSYKGMTTPSVYAAMASDEIREKSASGGIFTLLANYAFEKNGYVCGAVFTDDFKSVFHTMINNEKDLDPLRRSKYMQSENGEIHKIIREKLNLGEFVLFVGTPCQCAGLTTFLRKDYENLLMVDLICHGTPSPKAWNKFLEEVGGERNVKDVNFRYKGLIGWSATTYIQFEDGEEYISRFKDCRFEQASSKALISRKSCGTCQFARIPRQGDITIGDFWGITKYNPSLDDRKGTSAILINNEKGNKVVESIRDAGKFINYVEVPFYDAFSRNNSNIYRFPNTHPGRQKFFDEINNGTIFSKALNSAKKEKFDIVIFSIWYAANFGSMMTNFSLYKMLTDMGYNCIFADIPDHLWPTSQIHRDPTFVTRRFGYKHFQITGKYKNRTDLKKLNNMADIFLVGSDQIWNYNLCKSAETFFNLDFVDEHKKKIAYGTSFGHNSFRGTEEESRKVGFYLQRFDAISVREDYAVEMCKDLFGIDATQVLDPVFMCDKKHYFECIKESKLVKEPVKKRYLLAYILDPTDDKQDFLEEIANRMEVELLCIPNAHVKDDMRVSWRFPILENIDIEDWLFYFCNAEIIITDSFHGVCFSIIFEKQFIAIGNEKRGLERFYSLLSKLQLSDRLINSLEDEDNVDLLSRRINYSDVNKQLDILRTNSKNWICKSLEASKKAAVYSAYDLLDRRLDQLNANSNKYVNELKKQLSSSDKEVNELKKQLDASRKEEIGLKNQLLLSNKEIKELKEYLIVSHEKMKKTDDLVGELEVKLIELKMKLDRIDEQQFYTRLKKLIQKIR